MQNGSVPMNLLTPISAGPAISRLPSEILVQIIEIVILRPPTITFFVTNELDFARDNYLLISLSHVCQAWRSIILESPTLWSFVSTSDRSVVTRNALQRSQGTPLSLDLNLFSLRTNPTEVFGESQARFKSLVVDVSRASDSLPYILRKIIGSPAPAIESVTFISRIGKAPLDLTQGKPLFSEMHPRLRCVRSSRVALPWNSSAFTNLTQLAIKYLADAEKLTFATLFSMLEGCPKLVDLELVDAVEGKLLTGRKRPLLLVSLRTLAFYMPQHNCRRLLASLDLPKLARLNLSHDEPCSSDPEQLLPSHIKPALSSQAIEVTIKPSLNYISISLKAGLFIQHPETFYLQLYHRHSKGFGSSCNFITSAILNWDPARALKMSVKILVAFDPSGDSDIPEALGTFFSAFPNIISIKFCTPANFGYEGDVWDALYIFEETVRHGTVSVPVLEELIFERMRFKDALVDLRHILKFRVENSALRPRLFFKQCPGIHLSEVRQLRDEGIIGDFSI